MEVGVIYEDDELLVIDKPSGVTVNRADTTKGERTVQDWVEDYTKVPRVVRVSRVPQGVKRTTFPVIPVVLLNPRDTFAQRAGIVHRLDKETSGLLLIAKTPEGFANLQQQFKDRTVKKTYLGLVHGEVKPAEGEIKVPVARLPWNRKRFGVVPGGREAVTKYKILRYYDTKIFGKLTLVELYPQTGRTHQIRVHLKYLGHPIVADPLYGGRKQAAGDRKWCKRLFLHAKAIEFTHPKMGKEIRFVSELTDDLQKVLAKFEARNPKS
ncbi:RluA family pseudouridine synthase [Candidatus Microgenomates bacterium]|nr:RluA family pseudouridine synthase [Candidatus Microgenomates bacterium]